jgi:hypothetical protein
MDNIIEYIVFIFFLISILNGIFGKKKKKQQQADKDSQTVRQQRVPESESQEKKPAQNILEELFGLKMPSESSPSQERYDAFNTKDSKSRDYQKESSWDPEEDYDDYFTKTLKKATPAISEFKAPKSILKLDDKIPGLKNIPAFEQNIPVKENLRRKNIKSKLKDPKSLRDYIIVQELLNEPKAFRI